MQHLKIRIVCSIFFKQRRNKLEAEKIANNNPYTPKRTPTFPYLSQFAHAENGEQAARKNRSTFSRKGTSFVKGNPFIGTLCSHLKGKRQLNCLEVSMQYTAKLDLSNQS